ncbi:Inositol 2-dehydrogenase [Posidoniimonas polymericola]|uniref:Inositol 2-dehydrogenase n=1 Tax=Posidoniimonas polymericola TaxID=2528002 RepID=A0A5C5YTQ6_9BACT|nr:Gfo/Idh/MocA family oxidoreductase [Posidoniimonas polymericola]TWT78394.1 Inositol 2-dehydrogenase [Posidoniimonas polymericola]
MKYGSVVAASALGLRSAAAERQAPIERPVVGMIGTGIRFQTLSGAFFPHADIAALCDVDPGQLALGVQRIDSLSESKSARAPTPCDDYRRILERDDVDAVVIATPDHWHVKIAIEAMHAGKDVYCEKPLTLTIDEGRQIAAAVRATGRVVQVGAHQRSARQFQLAAALLRDGRIGKPRRVTCAIGDSPVCDPLPPREPPAGMDWDRWLGPTPAVAYRASPTLPESGYGSQYPYSRGHVHFRWWYEYGGGKITDWGAHHVDIALWALGDSIASDAPYEVTPLRVVHPVALRDGYPTEDDRFNVATEFHARVRFGNGVELDVVDTSEAVGVDNAILFEGEQGRYLVNRGKLVGKPVEEIAEAGLPTDELKAMYPGLQDGGAQLTDQGHEFVVEKHVKNFVSCLQTRATPISSVDRNRHNLNVCHAINVALRLGRNVTFDPSKQRFVDDALADSFLARPSRPGYEIDV